MVRIKNNPAKYVTRSKKLPSFVSDANSCSRRSAERERSFFEAPISAGFYIDHRPCKRDINEKTTYSPTKPRE